MTLNGEGSLPRSGVSQQLASEVNRLRALADAAFEGLAIHKNGHILHANEALARMIGCEVSDLIGAPILRFAAPESHELIKLKLKENAAEPYEVLALRLDGSRFPAELQGKTAVIDGVALRISSVRDISEQKRLEQELARSHDQYRQLFQKAADGIGIARTDGTIESFNPSVQALLGYSQDELEGKNFALLVAEASKQRVPIRWDELENGQIVKGERTLVHKNGKLVQVELNSSPLGNGRILTIFRDVSERNALREQLMQSQKLESLGRLAGGIAHDFNNLLTVTLSNAELLRQKLLAFGDLQLLSWVQDITRSSQRAAELTQQLLAFSRKQVVQRSRVDVNEVVREMESMFRRVIGEDIEVLLDLEEPGAAIYANKSQLIQVLMNLAINARDAMPSGGRFTMQTRIEAPQGSSPFATTDSERPRREVVLTVADTGVGMTEEVLRRAFEPFFTTKALGEGTGLGLATVYGIVMQHNGQVELRSTLAQGTTFRISFPVTEVEAERTPRERVIPASRNRASILLVEDERAVADVARRILQGQGYSVQLALSPDEALRQLPKISSYELLITDVVMPGMNGYELSRKFLSVCPELKVLFTSGYTDEFLLQRGIDAREMHFLPKPFNARLLIDKVQEVLGLQERVLR